MKKPSRTLTGQLIDNVTKQGVSNLRIEAWDSKSMDGNALAASTTDEEGKFFLHFNSSSIESKKPELIFRIYRGDQLIHSEPLGDRWNANAEISIPLALPGPELPQLRPSEGQNDRWRIVGRITKANGEPVPAVVRAVSKRLNGEQPLGEASADSGAYLIAYPPPVTDSQPQGCKLPDIQVHAFFNDRLIASSDVIYNASKVTTVDLVAGNEVYRGPSEYQRLEHTIRPCLGDTDPATLTVEHVGYLSNKTGVDQKGLMLYVLAHRQGKLTTAPPPLFYACYRQKLPYGLDKLAALRPAVIISRITKAVEDNIIDQRWEGEIERFVVLLDQSAIESALAIDPESTQTSLGKVFSLIAMPAKSQRDLLGVYLKNKKDLPAFWKKLGDHKTLGPFADKLRLVLKVSALTQHYEPATRAIMALPVFNQQADIARLTQLTSAEWTQLAKRIGAAPATVPGEGADQLVNYGRLMEKTLARTFPTQHIAANLVRNKKYQSTELPKFFEVAPEFSFAGTNIPVYVKKLDGAITDKNAVINDLSRLQRLYYLAPSDGKYNTIEVLDKEGMGSALQIRQYGKRAFINTFSKKLGSETVASQVFSKAIYINATAMNIAVQYQDFNTSALPYVLQGNSSGNKADELELPNLSTLFGGQSFCACKHCRSVYSPAAYLVDLLSYLNEHYAIDQQASTPADTVYKEGVTGLSLFFARRPEIGHLILNCENTSTLIPYLDIVNEVLENAVVSSADAYQTTSTSDELKANPEHLNKDAYNKFLAIELFPYSQPFNLWNEEASVYLEHLGVPRYQLIETFQYKGTPNEPDNEAKFTVQLNLTGNGRKIITGETTIDGTPRLTKDFWGTTDATWQKTLSNVRTFLDKAGITYEQLLQFLQVKYANPDGTLGVKFLESAPCDLEQATLAYWDEASQRFSTEKIKADFFVRAHRFFRLLPKTSWTVFELGNVMDSLEVTNINSRFIAQVAVLLRAQSETKRSVLELLSWWATLNTQSDENDLDDRSFYAQHFLNKTVFDPAAINDSTFVFTLNADRTELNLTGNEISNYLNEIAAALTISSSELLLLTATLQTADGLVNDELTLANLSQLFRMVSLVKAMDISVEEYLIAIRFIRANPFDKATANDLPEFIRQLNQIKESAFSLAELQYLLLNEYNSTEGIAPAEDKIIALLTALQEGLRKLKAEHEVPLDENGVPVDPTGELCRQKLALLLEAEAIDRVVAILEATGRLSPEHKADATTYLSFLDVNQLIRDFSGVSHPTVEARYVYLLKALVSYLTVTQSRSFVVQTLATDLSVDLITSDLLLTKLVFSSDPARSADAFAIDDFLTPDFAYDELTEGESFDLAKFSVQQATYVVLHKSALFITKFGMNAEEVSWTFTKSPTIGWLDLNAISGTATDVFQAWRRMENFFHMRKAFPEGDISFFDLMDYAAKPALLATLDTGYDEAVDAFIAGSTSWTTADRGLLIFLSLLSEMTGWETDSLFHLASDKAYAVGFNDFRDEQTFCQFMQCFRVLHTLGASAADAWNWMSTDLTDVIASNIKQTAKAKYSETDWLVVARPLRDVLREKQRDALTTYLIQNRGFKDEHALYEYYLLDVEMSACMITSRIVLANSSVQLFVQRCLMNLEKEILDLDVERWQWMKNYRVWEANRKVFLYPENWIEPELRITRSEFFTDLQHALLQNDVTADLVETTLLDYLEKLDAVSNIDVCGMYRQYEAGEGATSEERSKNTIDVLHVFGRTSGVPPEYYYRTYVAGNYWTPWEKVNLDVQGQHMIPVVINRRLHLFWPEFTEKQVETGGTETLTYWEIKLAYSEYKNGKWLAKKVSSEFIESNQSTVALSLEAGTLNLSNYGLHNFCFLTTQSDTYLKIKCVQLIDSGLSDNYQYENGDFKFYFDRKKIVAETYISSVIFGLFGVPDLDLINNLVKPAGTNLDYMTFKEVGSSRLELTTANVTSAGNFDGNESYETVLDLTPGSFRIPLPHQYDDFVSQTDFFYGDDYRNFFVKPYRTFGNETIATSLNDFNVIGSIKNSGIDHILSDKFVEVGIFNEIVYTHSETSILLFEKQLTDIVTDPFVPSKQISGKSSTEQELLSINHQPVAKKADRLFTDFDVNQQANQFEFLGDQKYRFANFYHPYVNDFIKAVNRDGVQGLLTREMQQQTLQYFKNSYLPTDNVHEDYPVQEVDFATEGAMSIYNWELFLHIPMLIADRLSKNQRFEEAQKWYHFIFNPTDRSSEPSPNKFWQCKPLFDVYAKGGGAAEDSIYNLMYALSYSGTDTELLDKKAEVEKQVDAWLKSPFDPHAIAALRPVGYMKSIVMKYIDNLIDWGDFKFGQDTIESINEATQVYILAAQILGRRPEQIPVEEAETRTYNQLASESGELDAFSNALVTLENTYNSEALTTGSSGGLAEFLPKSLYFCIPNNPNLLGYWDTVEDRLFKIRHCMNIEGVVRQLPLFQPPIDPAMLVSARAAGLDIGSVLNDLSAPLPHYRYRVMLQKANEFCSDVKALGSALLSALEKRDAEEMALLRAGHERKLLELITDLRKLQLDESKESLSALKLMRKITEARQEYYATIEKLNTKEALHLNLLESAQLLQGVGQGYDLAAQYSRLFPEVKLGAPPAATFGGANLGDALSFYGSYYRFLSSIETYKANKAAIQAGHDRRWDDWKLQEKLASRELDHIDKQIIASDIRVALMEKEIENHAAQVENSAEANAFMTSKFTNTELYNWMTGQLSTVYFQSYQMAYDLAKKAQRCFQHELGTDQTFIQFGYWDSFKKGLLAGEKLHYDLKRMEVAYLEGSQRTYELTKSVSLAMIDPLALVQLRETGTCYVNLPEALFDLDYPGHYLRRLKSVQLTLPCVTGPYTSVNCKLTLLNNKWRKDSSGDSYPENTSDFDSRFIYNAGGTQSIATSSGQQDSGLFQLNFNDECYLPFEGAGAISNWRLELPAQMRAFDYNTLSDVIVQLNYTAKEGGNGLKEKVSTTLQEALMAMALGSQNTGLTRMFSLKHEFANEWYRFLTPPLEQEGQHILIGLDSTRFPYLFQQHDISISVAEIILVLDTAYLNETIPVNVIPPGGSAIAINLTGSATLGGQLSGRLESLSVSTGQWQIAIDEGSIPSNLKVTNGDHVRLNKELVKNMIIILTYGIRA